MTRARPVADRFWSKVQVTPGCWLWTASLQTSGYGQMGKPRPDSGILLAHRVSYELHFGQIPPGLIVRHKCDNRVCVNPEHLELGTHDDNMKDMVARGRSTVGERNGQATLTAVQVQEIRASTEVQHVVAARHGISQTHVSAIRLGKRWSKVA